MQKEGLLAVSTPAAVMVRILARLCSQSIYVYVRAIYRYTELGAYVSETLS